MANQHQWCHDLLISHQADAAPLELAAPHRYVPHPWRILEAYLPSRSKLKYCVKQLDFSPKTLRALIKGSIDVTKELAVLLGSVWPWHSAAF